MRVVVIPGLRRQTGLLARCVLNTVEVDPQTRMLEGGNSLVAHECVHASRSHWLGSLVLACIPVVGWLLYPLYRRQCEISADKEALRLCGEEDFRVFVFLHPHPVTAWGRFLYGKDQEERLRRVGL